MAWTRHTEEEALKILRETEVHLTGGNEVPSAYRQAGISDATFDIRSRPFGGMGRPQLAELKALQKENERLKRTVAELALDCPWSAPLAPLKRSAPLAPLKRSAPLAPLMRSAPLVPLKSNFAED